MSVTLTQYCRYKIISDSFNFIKRNISFVQLFWLSKNGAFGVNTHDLAVRATFLDFASETSDCAPCTGSDHQHVHLVITLLYDFLGRRVVMSQRIAFVAILNRQGNKW